MRIVLIIFFCTSIFFYSFSQSNKVNESRKIEVGFAGNINLSLVSYPKYSTRKTYKNNLIPSFGGQASFAYKVSNDNLISLTVGLNELCYEIERNRNIYGGGNVLDVKRYHFETFDFSIGWIIYKKKLRVFPFMMLSNLISNSLEQTMVDNDNRYESYIYKSPYFNNYQNAFFIGIKGGYQLTLFNNFSLIPYIVYQNAIIPISYTYLTPFNEKIIEKNYLRYFSFQLNFTYHF